MIQQSSRNGKGHRLQAADTVLRLQAGVKVLAEHDYGEYREVVEALISAAKTGGPEAAKRAFTVLKKAQPALADLELRESFYPPSRTFDENDLSKLDALPYTDAGQAEAVAMIYAGTNLRFNPGLGWLIWTDSAWRVDDRGAAYQFVLVVSRTRQQAVFARPVDREDSNAMRQWLADIKWAKGSESKTRLEASLDLASKHPDIVVSADELDADPYLLGAANGTVDLRTGELLQPSPNTLITMRTDIPYFPEATCPRWEKFLSEIFQGNGELIEYVQRAVGYSLTGDISEQCFWIMHGSGSNGKSTFMDILMLLGGDYAANTPFNTFELGKQTSVGDDLARLRGKRVVTASESDGGRLNEARVKAITGGDNITARFLHGRYFTYTPQFHVWLASNHKPTITGTDMGIWRRVRLLPFNVRFEGSQVDKALPKKLEAELPGILAWAVRGARAWMQRGLTMPAAVEAATQEYRSEMDILGRFIDETCQVEAGVQVKAGDLYKAYKQWCDDNGINRPMTNVAFGQKLVERGFESTGRTAKGYYWKGLTILAENMFV
jgi:putative DNA primase/helicase